MAWYSFDFQTHKYLYHYSKYGMVQDNLIKLPHEKMKKLIRKKLNSLGLKEGETYYFEDDQNYGSYKVFLRVSGLDEIQCREFSKYFNHLKIVYYNDTADF